MKKIISISTMFSLALALIIFFACQDVHSPNTNNNSQSGPSGNITGKVITKNNTVVPGVQVKCGNVIAYTDSKGIFILTGVPVSDRAIVSFTMNGYCSTQKITPVQLFQTSWIDASMELFNTNITVNLDYGGTTNFQNASLTLPPSGFIDSKGNVYHGNATLHATYFDPTDAQFIGCFPGEFTGTRTDNSETPIESFGFITVEVLNGTEKLNLASGKIATLVYPIPASKLAKAPATIPLWYYNETSGKWIEDGSATKTGNNYVATVSHFSQWNCDMPQATSYIKGIVVDSDGNPISFAKVHTVGVDYTGSSVIYTKSDGTFKVGVKSASNVTIFANYFMFVSATSSVSTAATGDTMSIPKITISIDTSNMCVIIGTVVDNGNNPVQYISISIFKPDSSKALDNAYTTQDGKFKFFGELGATYYVVFYGLENNQGTDSNMITKNITCPTTAGTLDMGTIQMNIGGATIIGRCIDANSNPLPKVYVYGVYATPSNTSANQTDSLGKFKLWVLPNKTFDIYFYFSQKDSLTNQVSATSGILGSTTDIGDIILK